MPFHLLISSELTFNLSVSINLYLELTIDQVIIRLGFITWTLSFEFCVIKNFPIGWAETEYVNLDVLNVEVVNTEGGY